MGFSKVGLASKKNSNSKTKFPYSSKRSQKCFEGCRDPFNSVPQTIFLTSESISQKWHFEEKEEKFKMYRFRIETPSYLKSMIQMSYEDFSFYCIDIFSCRLCEQTLTPFALTFSCLQQPVSKDNKAKNLKLEHQQGKKTTVLAFFLHVSKIKDRCGRKKISLAVVWPDFVVNVKKKKNVEKS